MNAELFPRLKSLGIRNTYLTDEIVEVLTTDTELLDQLDDMPASSTRALESRVELYMADDLWECDAFLDGVRSACAAQGVPLTGQAHLGCGPARQPDHAGSHGAAAGPASADRGSGAGLGG